MTSIMEAPTMLENGKAPQKRKSKCFQVAFHVFIFVLIIISFLVSVIFCLRHHMQEPGLCWAHGSFKQSSIQNSSIMIWDWKLDHCNGIVRDQGEYLVIEQSGHYFIYAQLYRMREINESFTMFLFKVPRIPLNNAVGHGNGTLNFARLFFLKKGEKLFCEKNDDSDHILLKNQTYWGLFKM